MSGLRVAVVGAGWAGLAAAEACVRAGAAVTLLEATAQPGGRARALAVPHSDGTALPLDNGQHILIGAYVDTLALMERVGVDLGAALWPMPLALPFADGGGLDTPRWAAGWPAPLAALAAIATAGGWDGRDRAALVARLVRWRLGGFRAPAGATVSAVCAGLPPRVVDDLIEPLCVSALNLPAAQASGAVFLRVLRDAFTGRGHAGWAPSALLLPRTDLGALLPAPALRWLGERGASVRLGTRVTGVTRDGGGWALALSDDSLLADRVVWATGAAAAAKGLSPVAPAWAAQTGALPHTAIATVWAHHAGGLGRPMVALRGGPAQFAFDRGALAPQEPALRGVLAFVASAAEGERDTLQAGVLAQAQAQLGLAVTPLQTVVERRATFACTPGLVRPAPVVAPGLWAAGDYVDGPYPATLEGAVRSARAAAAAALA